MVHKALLAGELDSTSRHRTALTAVLNETPQGDSAAVYDRVKLLYSERFHLEVTEPLGFENTLQWSFAAMTRKNFICKKFRISSLWHQSGGQRRL